MLDSPYTTKVLPAAPPKDRLYDRNFFLGFSANFLFMLGQSLMFNFSRYVVHLGGDDKDVGLVTGIGTAVVLASRPWMGGWVDRFGTTRLWMLGLALYAVASAGNLLVTEVGPALFALRILWNVGWGLAFVCNTAYPAQTAPPGRRAEAIGAQGIGGFVGMMIGPKIAAQIFLLPDEVKFTWLFAAAGGAVMMGAVLVSRLDPPIIPLRLPGTEPQRSIVADIMHHWPGTITLVGLSLGLTFALTMSFVARHADHDQIGDYSNFFLVYAPAAAGVRIFFRRLPETLGRRGVVLLGLLCGIAGYESLPFVETSFDYVWPGLLLGLSHGFIFPSMVDLAGECFPPDRRGLGTSVIIGAQEFGLFIGAPVMGWVVKTRGFDPMFHLLAGLAGTVAVIHILSSVRGRRRRKEEACRSTNITAGVATATSSSLCRP